MNELQQSADEVQTAIVSFDKVQAGIAALREQYANVIFQVSTPAGMKDAREARAKIREPRYLVEQVRKGAKAPILKIGRLLDTRAAEITGALLALEMPIDEAIKFEEGRKEREAQVIREAERAAEEARQAAERAEIERLRAEIARRDAEAQAAREAEAAKERAIRAEEEANARAIREAEEAARRAEVEAERKRQAEERAAIDAENKRQAEERAAFAAEQAQIRRAAEQAEQARQAEIAAERARKESAERAAKKAKYPGERAIVDAICDHFGVPAEVAEKWVAELKAAQ